MQERRVISLEDVIDNVDFKEFYRPFVIPTETVYGLAARYDDIASIQKIFEIKGRPNDNPLILHISNIKMLDQLIKIGSKDKYERLISNFWPGPLTLIFESNDNFPKAIQGACHKTVAIRMPRNETLRALIDHIGVPLAAPSANTSGRPSPTRVEYAISDLQDKVSLYIDNGPCTEGLESTIFGYIHDVPTLLRPGAITKEALEAVLETKICIKNFYEEGDAVLCPGQKYRHYAPSAPVYLFKSQDWRQDMKSKALELKCQNIGIMCTDRMFDLEVPGLSTCLYFMGDSPEERAHNIFAGLRDLDLKSDIIFVNAVDPTNLGLAIMDRLIKASSYIID